MYKIKKEVVYTNGIPQCPHCEKPTKRTSGISTVTSAYYAPIYDENGVNINPDRNTQTSNYNCHECKQDFMINGNKIDGYNYK